MSTPRKKTSAKQVKKRRSPAKQGKKRRSPAKPANEHSHAPKGRIITFYSYKGGTGRTMALANVAWILASRGERVLVIDWDLEAPGLHRYFHPFIDDKELTNTTGLIDFLSDFVEAARHHAGSSTPDWFEPYSHLARHAGSLAWDFPGNGTVDLVPAGRQGASYATSVTSFNWSDFYERLGGGVFLEAVKRSLRSEYDYILIDSRTGIADTSGICTIQMPDDLVVCFTLNMQSIRGAAATAESAFQQRITPGRTPGLRVWPVPTRVELAERDRLERARDDVHARFQKFLHHLPANERSAYWGSVEVLYQPFFAYEEVLAVLAERRQQTGSLLQSFEHLTHYLTGGSIESLGEVNEAQRRVAVSSYADTQVGPFFLSYSRTDEDFAVQLATSLRRHFGSEAVLWDRDLLRGGDQWGQTLSAAMNRAQAILPLVSKNYVKSVHGTKEAAYAIGRQLPVVPVLLPGNSWAEFASLRDPFKSLSKLYGFAFAGPQPTRDGPRSSAKAKGQDSTPFERDVEQLVDILRSVAGSSSTRSARADPNDPHRGRFGGRSERDGYTLTASVDPLGDDWFDLGLRVAGTGRREIGEVEFHLHPTFDPPIRRVSARTGAATLQLDAWGAFTVGAVVLDTLTQLELDLSTVRGAPKAFRER